MGRLRSEQFNNFHGLNLVRDVFVETGTFRGETLAVALAAGYKEVHTIDVVEEYTKHAKSTHGHNPALHCHTGTSPDVLPSILDPNKSYTFWLDAHYQAHKPEETCEKYGECPVLQELKVIFLLNWVIPPIVLVDDAHVFKGNYGALNPEHWPKVDVLKKALPENYTMEEFEDIFLIRCNM